ncbi:MAG: CheB methylesterase domain-containing protein, partial [Candidatus Sericytochromatia bacterium]
ALPADFPLPVLVVQHMPAGFTAALAERLNRLSPLQVKEAAGGEAVHPGGVWIAPGGRHLEARREGGAFRLALTDAPPENSCRPSADVLFRSAGEAWGGRVLALVLTGMGSDGLAGARRVKALGGAVLAQDERSSVVWGMPGAVVQAGLANAVVGLEAMPEALVSLATGVPPCPR